jgi:YjjG family noncanonical pyrimidine nucleotidase
MRVELGRTGATAPTGPRLEADVLLLDLDDTILDHDACERAAVAATMRTFDLDPTDVAVDTYVRHNAALWEQYRRGAIGPELLRSERWDRTLSELGMAADLPAISAHYLEQFAATGALLPGAAEALWWLARRARVAICTNGFRAVQAHRLAATGLGGLVDAFASSEEAGVAKPDPAPLRLALERLGTDAAARVVMVGDQLATDVAAGHAIGATTVWITPDDAVVPAGLRAPHVQVDRLAALA